MAYMIYITNVKAKINILSITAGAGNIGYLLLTIHSRVLQRCPDP